MPQALLSARGITRAIGPRTILHEVALDLDDGARVGLIGPNGSGKSTLMRVLAGVEPPDAGSVVLARDAAVLYLPSSTATTTSRSASPCTSCWASHRPADGWTRSRRSWRRASSTLSTTTRRRCRAGSRAAVTRSTHGLTAPPPRRDWTRRCWRGPERNCPAASGRERCSAAIGAARAEVLLLDEPANHLDGDGLERLRRLLLARSGGLVLVAHDRALLATVCDRVVELDPRTGAATTWSGGWDAYERERARSNRQAIAEHDRAAAERTRLTGLARAARERSAQGQRRARSDAEPDKNLRRLYQQSAQGSDALAGQLRRRADACPCHRGRVWRRRPPHVRRGRPPTMAWSRALEHAVLRRGDSSSDRSSSRSVIKERVLLAGPNGCGKSTVIAALAGRLEPSRGRARRTAAYEVGQERTMLLAGDGPLVSVTRAVAGLDERAARASLAAIGLDSETVQRPVATPVAGRTDPRRAGGRHRREHGCCCSTSRPTTSTSRRSRRSRPRSQDWPGALVVATHDARLRARCG